MKTHPESRRGVAFVFALLLSAATLTSATDFGAEVPQKPTRLIKFDLLDAGLAWFASEWVATPVRVLQCTYTCQSIRIGASVAEAYRMPNYDGGESMLACARAGYTLWSRPVRTGFCYGAVPDVYAEACLGFLNALATFRPVARLALTGDIDIYGVGARVESGWLTGQGNGLYLSFQLRLLTFAIGLN